MADVLVRVRGGTVCSGTPIAGTTYVVTAAHCVLDTRGGSRQAEPRTVRRGGQTYVAHEALVDDRYLDGPNPALDAAVLVMDQIVAGPAATIGVALPSTGNVTIAGYQPVDTDGTLLRGSSPHDLPSPTGATGDVTIIDTQPAGCTVPSQKLEVTKGRVDIACGLIPGVSGGGLFAERHGHVELVGIVSTVSADMTSNGIVPLDALLELTRHPERYRHDLRQTSSTDGHVTRN